MQNRSYTAKVLSGLENVLADELQALGAESVEPGYRVVLFKGDKELLYRAHLKLRTAMRILEPVRNFKAQEPSDIYREVKNIPWSSYLDAQDEICVDGFSYSTVFKNASYAALVVKDAIADWFRETFNKRPSVNTEDPDLRINLHINENECNLSLDASGDSLHKRGYRQKTVEAPLNEALAAGMVLMTGYDGSRPFLDPMCGSATIPIEAALIALNVAPGLLKTRFAFMRWKDYDSRLWRRVYREVQAEADPLWKEPKSSYYHRREMPRIFARDKYGPAINASRENIEKAGLSQIINLDQDSFFAMSAKNLLRHESSPQKPGIIVMNPPYGERLEQAEIEEFYKDIGLKFKQRFPGWEAWVLSGNKNAMKQVGLRADENYTLFNAGIECRYSRYRIFEKK